MATIDWPLTDDTIAYVYDRLGRVTQRTINGSANQIDWTFDALGRVTSEENLLGEFTYTYNGVTNRLATVTYLAISPPMGPALSNGMPKTGLLL